MIGGSGNDIIVGSPGEDTIEGGDGNDTLIGLTGDDRYVFKNGYGTDKLVDTPAMEMLDFSGATVNLSLSMSEDSCASRQTPARAITWRSTGCWMSAQSSSAQATISSRSAAAD